MAKENILITGASSGVGKELSVYLSERFNVIATARRLENMKENFSGNPGVTCYYMDLSDIEGMSKILSDIKARHGDIFYIINNAGVLLEKPVEQLELPQLQNSLTVNAVSAIIIIKAFLNAMKSHNFGRIINLTSGAPLNCFPNFGAYSGSKALLNSLTVTLAKELSGTNIKINLMSPGPVRSEMSPNSPMQPDVCFPTVDYLLNSDENLPTGKFFWLGYEVPLFPDLEGVQWLKGIGNEKLRKVL